MMHNEESVTREHGVLGATVWGAKRQKASPEKALEHIGLGGSKKELHCGG